MRNITNVIFKIAIKADECAGLGPFISKNIIDAHGCIIWDERNANDKNASMKATKFP